VTRGQRNATRLEFISASAFLALLGPLADTIGPTLSLKKHYWHTLQQFLACMPANRTWFGCFWLQDSAK